LCVSLFTFENDFLAMFLCCCFLKSQQSGKTALDWAKKGSHNEVINLFQ